MKLARNFVFLIALFFFLSCEDTSELEKRPNILFCIADDWGWPHAGVYGDSVVQTPVFDQLAKEGILFDQAYVSSPSCTPSRSAILTGQHFWRLEQAANLWSTLDRKFPVYPLLFEEAGYAIGSWRKSWGRATYQLEGMIPYVRLGQSTKASGLSWRKNRQISLSASGWGLPIHIDPTRQVPERPLA
jgi:hypothetical protein